jgi:TolA-binding protein
MMKIAFLTLMAFATSSVLAGSSSTKEDLRGGALFRNPQQTMDVMTLYIGDVETLMNERVGDLEDRLETVAAQLEANRGNSTLLQEQKELQDELIATLTGSVAELRERAEQKQEDVEEALELLEMTLEKAVTAIDSRLFALEGEIEALEHEDDTHTNGVALNAVAILQADALLHQKVGMIQDAIHATTRRATAANSVHIFHYERHLTAAQDEMASKQHRVLHVCYPGYSIRAIAEDGNVVCEADDSTFGLTSYTANKRATQYSLYYSHAYYAVAYCASGYTMSGGGFYTSSNGLRLRYSRPTGSNSGWELFTEYTPHAGNVHVYVRCIQSVYSSSEYYK